MNFDEIQPAIKALIIAHPNLTLEAVLEDDGTWPRTPGREAALNGRGICITIWQPDGESITDETFNGFACGDLYVPVVVEQNVTASAKLSTGAQTNALIVCQRVIEACVGRPRTGPNKVAQHRTIKLLDQPFKNFGKINGVNRIVVNLAVPFHASAI